MKVSLTQKQSYEDNSVVNCTNNSIISSTTNNKSNLDNDIAIPKDY